MFVYEAICYDLNGQSIDYFTQWDTNQKIVIRLEGCGDDYHVESGELQTVPEVHFTNIKRDTALAVKATLDGNDIVVDVPNLILEEPYPVLIYVYYTIVRKEDDVYISSRSTIARTEIAVSQKAQPHDYYYVENITTVTAEAIKQEVYDKISSEAKEKIESDVATLQYKMEEQLTKNNKRMDVINDNITSSNNRMNDIDNKILNKESSDSVVSKMAAIEDSFATTTDSLNKAIADLEDLRTFKSELESEESVSYVDVKSKTLYTENMNIETSMTMGGFIWVVHSDGSLSLQWAGGDE